eukprot:Clim_evm77s152 gene=Clim_evmTU77s152
MSFEWQEVDVVYAAIPSLGAYINPTHVVCDPYQELVWCAYPNGRVTSFLFPELGSVYTSLPAHHKERIRGLECTNLGVLSISATSAHLFARHGKTLLRITSNQLFDKQRERHGTNANCDEVKGPLPPAMNNDDDGRGLSASEFTSVCDNGGRPSFIVGLTYRTPLDHSSGAGKVMGGIFTIDAYRGSVLRYMDTEKGVYQIKRAAHHVVHTEAAGGKLFVRDAVTLELRHVIETGCGILHDIDVRGNSLAVSGVTFRGQSAGSKAAAVAAAAAAATQHYSQYHQMVNSQHADPLIRMYDLRLGRALAPVQFAPGARFLRFWPRWPTGLASLSMLGALQYLDTKGTMTPESMIVHAPLASSQHQIAQAGGSPESVQAVTFAVASQGTCVVVVDNMGAMHLFSDLPKEQLSLHGGYGEQVLYVDEPRDFVRTMVLPDDDSVSLGCFPLPATVQVPEWSIGNMDASYLINETPHDPDMGHLNNLRDSSPTKQFHGHISGTRYPGPRHHDGQRKFHLTGDMPYQMQRIIQVPIAQIPEELYREAKPIHNVLYAPSKGRNRGQLATFVMPKSGTGSHHHHHHHRSAKHHGHHSVRDGDRAYRDGGAGGHKKRGGTKDGDFDLEHADGANLWKTSRPPPSHRRVEVKFGRIGIDSFDFQSYNATPFASLESNSANAYCNSVLQVLYHLPFVGSSLRSHLCSRQLCLSCEMSFLFHMLSLQTTNKNCQASNFIRTLRTIPQATALGLVSSEDTDKAHTRDNLGRLIQNLNRFLHRQIHTETHTETGGDWNRKDSAATLKKYPENRWLIDDLSEEGGKTEESEPYPNRAIGQDIVRRFQGTNTEIQDICGSCKQVKVRSMETFIIDMHYPPLTTQQHSLIKEGNPIPDAKDPHDVDPTVDGPTFGGLISNSVDKDVKTRAFCENCQKYSLIRQKKHWTRLPHVMNVNLGLDKRSERDYWKAKGRNWVPHRLGMRLNEEGSLETIDLPTLAQDSDNTSATDDPDEAGNQARKDGYTIYHLCSVISYIQDEQWGNTLVAHIRMDATHFERIGADMPVDIMKGHRKWYIFNDFCIRPSSGEEATLFNDAWKTPVIAMFVDERLVAHDRCEIPNLITDDVLLMEEEDAMILDDGRLETSIKDKKNKRERKVERAYTPLVKEELPDEHSIMAIDAEFVALKHEERIIRSDGTKSTVKPIHMGLARVSVVRGQGDTKYEPCIDDYIQTNEEVVDYLTDYSGIEPGDLDPKRSTKNLCSLKWTYLKLRRLIDRGVKLVGHGLKQDFRTINILVPADQIIDTVDIFHLPHQRKIRLRFLAWFLLEEEIQSETHDSIEDALTALKVYERYLQLKEEGTFNQTLQEIYEEGRRLNWTPPHWES